MRVVPRQNDLLGLLHGYIDMLRLRAVAASTTTAALSAGHIRDLFSAIAASKSERGTVGEQSGVKAARLSAINADLDRKSVVEGKSVSVHVDRGGRRIINKKQYETLQVIQSL